MKDRIVFEPASLGGVSEGYELWWSTAADGPFSVVETAAADAREFSRSVEATGVAYYRVAATGEGDRSPASDVVDNSVVAIEERIGVEQRLLMSSNGEVRLVLPAGAFSEPTTVTIDEVSGSPTGGIISLAGIYDIAPSGVLGAPARLSIAYALAVTHHEVSATLVRAASLLTLDSASGGWIPGAREVSAAEGFISGTVDHFSPWFPGSPIPHGTNPEAADYCDDVCHDITTYPGSSTRYDTRDSQVCFNCHGNPDPAADPYVGPGERNIQGEFAGACAHPVAAGDLHCTVCHDPHATPASAPSLLRSLDPVTRQYVRSAGGVGPGNAFCWTCHGVARNRAIDYYVPGYYTRTGDKQTYLAGTPHASLPDPNGNDIACSACHSSHGSDSDALAIVGTVDGRTVTGNDQSLCLACHEAAVGGYSGEASYAMTKHSTVTESSVAATSYPTSDSAAGACQNCHDPHGSSNGDYLRATGRTLCSGCHDAAGLSYPADYSYQGVTDFDVSGHTGLAGTLSYAGLNPASEGFAAWESGVTTPTPDEPGTPVTEPAALGLLASLDGQPLRTKVQGTTGSYDYQMFRFKASVTEADIVKATLRWAGYGEETAGYPVTLSVWSFTADDWERVADRVMGTTQLVTTTIRPADHMDAEGHVYFLARARHVVDGEIVSGPTFTKMSDTSIKVQWTTAGNTTTWVDYGLTTAYNKVAGTVTRTTSHSVTISGLTPGTWHFRVRSASGRPEDSEDYVSGDYAYGFPMPKLALPYPASHLYDGTTVSRSFYWQAMTGAAGPYEYRFQLWRDGSLLIDAPWGSYTSYTYGGIRDVAGYAWRVEARDAQGLSYGWSLWNSFSVYEASGSCPFLFTWDGEKYAFEADLYDPGKLGLAAKTGYVRPTPDDLYVVQNQPAARNGTLDLTLVEERYEVDYLDELTLYALDVPAGREVYAEKSQAGGAPFKGVAAVLHTVSTEMAKPVSAVHVQTGLDVLDLVSADDGRYAVLNEERNTGFTYQTIEIDLGDVADAPQVKIVMDAISLFPLDATGAAYAATFGPRTKMEVQDSTGAWVAVPTSTVILPKPAEFSRPYVFDISNIWRSDSRKVRFTWLFKTVVDWIAVDTTADLPVTVTEAPLLSAIHSERGYDQRTEGEIFEYVYGEPSGRTGYFPGSYTRLGEVAPLLDEVDDMFVISGGGDEIHMTFDESAPAAEGTTRRYAMYANGYYKDMKTDVAKTVEPLPFAAMSNFPYGDAEHYPDDAEHHAYRAEWNTRLKLGTADTALTASAVEIKDPLPADSFKLLHVTPGEILLKAETETIGSTTIVPVDGYQVEHRSLNTDLVALDLTIAGPAGGGECGVCHNVHGGSDSGIDLDGGRAASDGRTCTADGTGGCHSSAANSASGIDIGNRFTANADPRAHHDVAAEDQLRSGSRVGCADCHNPHTNDREQRYSDPDAIAQPVESPLESLIAADGSVYVLVGAAHDGIPPTVGSIGLSAIGAQYLAPTVTWTTNERAKSWVDWGLTTSYELGNETSGAPFGNDNLVTSHSVQMSGLQAGVLYHYRVRTADALGNVAYSTDRTYMPVAPPPAPVMSNITTVAGTGWGPISVTLGASAVTSSDGHPVEYEFRVDGSSAYSSGWISDPSAWTSPAWLYTGTHYAQVRARDVVDTDAVSAWSASDPFTVEYADESGSCPFLFTWDGERFAFEADMMMSGKLGNKIATGYQMPNPQDAYTLGVSPAEEDGRWKFRMVEERYEVDYIDDLQLFAADAPEGYEIYAEKPGVGGTLKEVAAQLHTVRMPVPPLSAVRTDTGEDILASVSSDDEVFVVLNEDREDFTYKTIELDLGDVASAPQVKLLIDGVSAFFQTPEGTANSALFGPRTKVEVQRADGSWYTVPSSELFMPVPPEFARTYVFDVTRALAYGGPKIRLTFLYKTYIDMIRVDVSADQPVVLTEAPLLRADLRHHGVDGKDVIFEDVFEHVYGPTNDLSMFFPGAYTAYGDVAELLSARDDKFVIMGGGDEIDLEFGALAPPAEGYSRRLVLGMYGFYRDTKTDLPRTVEPPPFSGMSSYPYGEDEHYPDDAEHQAYRAEWNTRLKTGEMSAAVMTTSTGPVLWRTLHATSPAQPLEYSVDTDLVRVVTYADSTVTTHLSVAGWESASPEAFKPTPTSPGSPAESQDLGGMSSSDDVYWRTDLATTDQEWNWQLMRFDLGADALEVLQGLALKWEGHGEPTTGYPAALYVWDPATDDWTQVSRKQMSTDETVQAEYRSVATTFCLKCHDGVAPEGVVVPATVKNIAATWSAPTGDFHGAGSGPGFGDTGLKDPYVRGQGPIGCTTCHDTHGSSSLYHVPEVVNGQAVAPITGNNMAALCRTCHVGNTYNWHLNVGCWCHYVPLWEPTYHDAAFDLNDSIDCLQCHGHGKASTHPAVDCEDCHNSAPRGVRAF